MRTHPLHSVACAIATALVSATSVSAAPLQLDHIPIVYYQFTGVGLAWKQLGQLDTLEGVQLAHGETVTTAPEFPDAAYDKPLIAVDDWNALGRLSPVALDNFELETAGEPWSIDGRAHRHVIASPEANYSTGTLMNISTRAWVAEGEAVAIAGFVIADRPRTVLIRGVGPTLAGLGVGNPVADPYITVYRRSLPLYESTDWGQWEKAQKIEAAELVGAFPLVDNSKDAALLIELEPFEYTVHMGLESGAPGIGMIEVYILPDSSLLPTQSSSPDNG